MSEKIMKKNVTSSKTIVSTTKKGLKHLRFVGIGREYVNGRLVEMQKLSGRRVATPDASSIKTNGAKEQK